MGAAWASIVVAAIGTVGTVLVALIHKLMRSNASEHSNTGSLINNVHTELTEMHGDVKRVDSHLQKMDDHVQRIERKLDGHIDWHLKEK